VELNNPTTGSNPHREFGQNERREEKKRKFANLHRPRRKKEQSIEVQKRNDPFSISSKKIKQSTIASAKLNSLPTDIQNKRKDSIQPKRTEQSSPSKRQK
jgi:hypothetical protein